MAWDEIENVKPSGKVESVPRHGVRIVARHAVRNTRYIALQIGADLARGIGLATEAHDVRLLFGSGPDAGKIGVAVLQGGGFRAKRQKSGHYLISISAASAAGLLSVDFPALIVAHCEAISPLNGQPPMFSFRASAEMLEAGDD